MLLAATAMSFLGEWQLARAREHGQSAAKAREAERSSTSVPIDDVIRPSRTFPKDAVNVKVTATGRWNGKEQLLVPDREQAGRTGLWVLTPLVRGDGSAVPVVRGWVASAGDAAAAAPSGDVETTVTGLLQPGEPPGVRDPGAGSGLPAGQIDRVAVAQLASLWQEPLITGFVVQETQTPAAAGGPAVVPPPTASGSLDWRNLSYAIQWWIFAAIGLLFWFRLVRDDHRGLLRRPDDDERDENPDEGEPAASRPGPAGTGDGTTVVRAGVHDS